MHKHMSLFRDPKFIIHSFRSVRKYSSNRKLDSGEASVTEQWQECILSQDKTEETKPGV